MYEKINAFNENNKKIIYNLLVLKGEALLKGYFLALRQGKVQGQSYSNFFTAISNQVDTLLIYFINDEISASLDDRGPLAELRDELINANFKEEDFKRLEWAKDDLAALLNERTDFIIGSNILDFKVNTFSTFEHYIDHLYESLITKSPRSNKKETQLIKLIEKYNIENDKEEKKSLLAKIKKINFYVSSGEKISYVLSRCDFEHEELINIRIFLDFYRSQRNTVHNLGVHKGESISIIVDGIEINLEQGGPSHTSDHNSAIFACRKLMNIYEDMLYRVSGVFIF